MQHNGLESGRVNVSIEDVATAAGISIATASRAIRGLPRVSNETRRKVLAVVEELGYVPSSAASNLASGRTRSIGVITSYVDRWFLGKAMEGVDRELHSRGYDLLLFNLEGRGAERQSFVSRALVSKHIDALVVLCLALSEEELDGLRRIDIPVVAVGGPVAGSASISIDDRQAAKEATTHLIHMGHTHIANLHGGGEMDLGTNIAWLRTEGFRSAMESAGLDDNPQWNLNGDFTVAGAQAAVSALMDRPGPKPTAIFCASDVMAMGALFELQRRGIRVPQEISLIGIDDHEFSAAAGMSTVRQDPMAQGQAGTKMLLDELDGISGALHSLVAPHELIVRRSTAPPRTR